MKIIDYNGNVNKKYESFDEIGTNDYPPTMCIQKND